MSKSSFLHLLWCPFDPELSAKQAKEQALHNNLKRLESLIQGPLSIVKGPSGQPFIHSPNASYSCSITHSKDMHLMAVAPLGTHLGVDIERANRLKQSVILRILSESEQEAFAKAGIRDKGIWAWTIWEAVSKALGLGLHFHFDPWRIKSITSEDQVVISEFLHFPILRAYSLESHGQILTLVLAGRLELPEIDLSQMGQLTLNA